MIKVGIVDDHQLMIEGLIDFLGKERFDFVLTASSGDQLLEKLVKIYDRGGSVDILILDVIMKPKHGTEYITYIKNEYPTIKIIILSSLNSLKTIKDHLSLGADTYLLKEESPTILPRAIEELHKHGFYCTQKMMDALRMDPTTHSMETIKRKLNLSDKELAIIKLMFYYGLPSKGIASFINVASGTVDDMKSKLYKKFRAVGETSVNNEIDLMRVAVQYNLVSIDEIEKRLSEDPRI